MWWCYVYLSTQLILIWMITSPFFIGNFCFLLSFALLFTIWKLEAKDETFSPAFSAWGFFRATSPFLQARHFGAWWDERFGRGVPGPGNDHISHLKVAGKMIFLFHRWDMLYSSQERMKAMGDLKDLYLMASQNVDTPIVGPYCCWFRNIIGSSHRIGSFISPVYDGICFYLTCYRISEASRVSIRNISPQYSRFGGLLSCEIQEDIYIHIIFCALMYVSL